MHLLALQRMKSLTQYLWVDVFPLQSWNVLFGKLQSVADTRNDSGSRFGLEQAGVSCMEGRVSGDAQGPGWTGKNVQMN